jgi:hypothetical protein
MTIILEIKNLFLRFLARLFGRMLAESLYLGFFYKLPDQAFLDSFRQQLRKDDLSIVIRRIFYSPEAWEKMKLTNAEEIVKESYLGVLGRRCNSENAERHIKKFEEFGFIGLMNEMVNSPEAWEKMKLTNAEEIVKESYLGVLGREGDPQGVEALVMRFSELGYMGLLSEMRNSKEAWEMIQDLQERRNLSSIVTSETAAPKMNENIQTLTNTFSKEKSLLLRSLLKTQDVVGKSMIRVGKDFDGGYIMVNHKLENSICYSLGISDDDSWDRDMAKLGCQVYQYDHTIEKFPSEHPNFHSFKIGICAADSDAQNLYTIPNLLIKNNHTLERDLILKMDIEGHEWDIFEQMSEDVLSQFSQIIVEMHHFLDAHHFHAADKYIKILSKLGILHQIVHIHANNCGLFGLVNGVPLADTFEITWVRKSDYDFEECKKVFPTPLDMPCEPRRPDYFLGAMGL